MGPPCPGLMAHVSVPSSKDETRSNLCLPGFGLHNQANYVMECSVEQCKLQGVYLSS